MTQNFPAQIHPQALAGLRLFNQGKYFEAHEELEAAWKEEKGQVRELYRGILQVGVAYYHILKRNYRGGKVMLERAQRWLSLFPQDLYGIHIQQLKQDAAIVYDRLTGMGPEKIHLFNPLLFRPLVYDDSDEQ